MQPGLKSVFAALCALPLCCGVGSRAQEADRNSTPVAKRAPARGDRRSLSSHDRSSVIAVALRAKRSRHAGRDCSHLVHAVYERAGFPYPYADSDDLYDGVDGFRRVLHPQPADLVVWHGHVGIFIRPAGHQFFSFLSKGPGIDDYRSRYWRGRGQSAFIAT